MNVPTPKIESEADKHAFLEQYKQLVETTLLISSQRQGVNKFYLGLITALYSLPIFLYAKDHDITTCSCILVVVSLASFAASRLWTTSINAYRTLNSAKFKVIKDMEEHLPYKCYDEEWKDAKKKNYVGTTGIERKLSLTIGSISFILIIVGIVLLVCSHFGCFIGADAQCNGAIPSSLVSNL